MTLGILARPSKRHRINVSVVQCARVLGNVCSECNVLKKTYFLNNEPTALMLYSKQTEILCYEIRRSDMSSSIMTNLNPDVTHIMSVYYFSYIARKSSFPREMFSVWFFKDFIFKIWDKKLHFVLY
jgi:hypothetical protein